MSRGLGTNTNQILQTNPAALHEIHHHKTEVCLTSVLSKDLTAPLEGSNCISQYEISGYISTQLVTNYLNPFCVISAEHRGVASSFLLPAFNCCDMMPHNVTQLPVSFQEQRMYFICVGWSNAVYSFQRWLQGAKYSRGGMGGRNIRTLLVTSFIDSTEFMVLCWCRKLLKT